MEHFLINNMNLNKKIKSIVLLFSTILIFWISVATIRFFYIDQYHIKIDQALNDKKHLVIIYSPACERCRSVLPELFLTKSFSRGREYVINSANMTKQQKIKSGSYLLPSFRYKGQIYETVDKILIQKIWNKSHERK